MAKTAEIDGKIAIFKRRLVRALTYTYHMTANRGLNRAFKVETDLLN